MAEHWLPKTTIAGTDTTVAALPKILSCLEGFDFETEAVFDRFLIIDCGGDKEKTILEVTFDQDNK